MTFAKVLGTINMLIGALFCALSTAAFVHIPATFAKFAKEPEDLYLSLMLFLLCGAVGGTSAVAGLRLLRKRTFSMCTWSRTSTLVIVVAGILVILSALGLWTRDTEMPYLLVPAATLVASYFVLSKMGASKN